MFGLKEYDCTSKVDNKVVVRQCSTVSDPLYLTWEEGYDTFNYQITCN